MLELVPWRPPTTRSRSAEPVRPDPEPLLVPRDFDGWRSPVSTPPLIERSLAAAILRNSPVRLFLSDPAKAGEPEYRALPAVTQAEPIVASLDDGERRPATGRIRPVASILFRLTVMEPGGRERRIHVDAPYLGIRNEEPDRRRWQLALSCTHLERLRDRGYSMQYLRDEMAHELVFAQGSDAPTPGDGARTAADRALIDAGLLPHGTPISLERWRGPAEPKDALRADIDPEHCPLVLDAAVQRELLDNPHLGLTLAYACRHHQVAVDLHLPDEEYRGNAVYEGLQRITGIGVERTPHGRPDLDNHEHGDDLHGSITVRLATHDPGTGAGGAIRIDTPFAFLGERAAGSSAAGFAINLGAAHVPDTPEIRDQVVRDTAKALFQGEDTPVHGDTHEQRNRHDDDAREAVDAIFQAAAGNTREHQHDGTAARPPSTGSACNQRPAATTAGSGGRPTGQPGATPHDYASQGIREAMSRRNRERRASQQRHPTGRSRHRGHGRD